MKNKLTSIATLLIIVASTAVFTGCQIPVPKTKLNIDPVTHAVTMSNPKDTSIKNFRAEVQTNGASVVSFDSLTTVMNPEVITTTGDAEAKMITATGQAVVGAINSTANSAIPK